MSSTMRVNLTSRLRNRLLRSALMGAVAVATVSAVAFSTLSFKADAAEATVRANRLIEVFKAGGTAVSGKDFQVIEAEHKTFVSREELAYIKIALDKKDAQGRPTLPPIVRLPMEGDENARWAIKAMLEGGAMGIIIPHLETSEDALRTIRQIRPWNSRDTKYPFPAGHRSGGGATHWGVKNLSPAAGDIWPLNPDGEILFLPMIESVVGVANVVDILETPGVSGIIVGPGDLSGSMGVSGGTKGRPPEVTAVIENVGRICRERKKFCGMVGSGEAETKKWLSSGYSFMWQLDVEDASSGNWYAKQYNKN